MFVVFLMMVVLVVGNCEVKVVSKVGKLLVGVVKMVFIKKCEGGSVVVLFGCEVKVVSKVGKLLVGVVKILFMKKCEVDVVK